MRHRHTGLSTEQKNMKITKIGEKFRFCGRWLKKILRKHQKRSIRNIFKLRRKSEVGFRGECFIGLGGWTPLPRDANGVEITDQICALAWIWTLLFYHRKALKGILLPLRLLVRVFYRVTWWRPTILSSPSMSSKKDKAARPSMQHSPPKHLSLPVVANFQTFCLKIYLSFANDRFVVLQPRLESSLTVIWCTSGNNRDECWQNAER